MGVRHHPSHCVFINLSLISRVFSQCLSVMCMSSLKKSLSIQVFWPPSLALPFFQSWGLSPGLYHLRQVLCSRAPAPVQSSFYIRSFLNWWVIQLGFWVIHMFIIQEEKKALVSKTLLILFNKDLLVQNSAYFFSNHC